MLHNNVRSLKRNLENFQTHLLQELDFNFSVIGITETKIRDDKFTDFNPEIVNYKFEFVPTPLFKHILKTLWINLVLRAQTNLYM